MKKRCVICGSYAINEQPQTCLCDRCFWKTRYYKLEVELDNWLGVEDKNLALDNADKAFRSIRNETQ